MGGVGRKGGYLQGCLGRMMGWDVGGGNSKHSDFYIIM